MPASDNQDPEQRTDKRAGDNIRPGVERVFQLATRKRDGVAHEASDEVAFHLREREEQLMERGLSEAAARAEAQRKFGDVQAAENSLVVSSERLQRRTAWRESISDVLHDAQFALRSLRRSPSFVTIALACLTLGIGANVAIFAVVDAVLLKPLPFRSPSHLVRVWSDGTVPSGVFEILKRESKSYTALEGAEGARQQSLTGIGDPARVMVSQTTAGIFDALGVAPIVGPALIQLTTRCQRRRVRSSVIPFGNRGLAVIRQLLGRRSNWMVFPAPLLASCRRSSHFRRATCSSGCRQLLFATPPVTGGPRSFSWLDDSSRT